MWPLTIGFVYRFAIVDVTANPNQKRVGRQYPKVIYRLAQLGKHYNKLTYVRNDIANYRLKF